MKRVSKISGFDIASRKTGWCFGDGTTRPDVGCFEFPSFDTFQGKVLVATDLGGLLDLWDRYLNHHFDRYQPDAAIYEKPIMTPRDILPTVRKLYCMGAHLEFVCHRRGIECSEVNLTAIKKEVTGNSGADKDAMKAQARRCGIVLPSVGADDAADAWGAWLIGLRSYNPEESRRWDSIIWGRRGALL